MKFRAFILLLFTIKRLISQDFNGLFSVPTDGQVALSITMMRTYGKLNYPEVFEDDSCYYIYNAGLIDSMAIPSGLDLINEKINIFSNLKIDVEQNFSDVQNLVKEFVERNSSNIIINTHCCLRNKSHCIQLKYSPVYANRFFTAYLRKPEDSVHAEMMYYLLFVLDERGDIIFFEVYDFDGNLAR